MVLFKRKPITFLPPPQLPADANANTPVWVIPETGEWFIDYNSYLDRLSFYNIKKFVCETSGNSNFTFFEALKVEHNELFLMQSNFPDPVKEPILRFVSFSIVPRIDQLVDQVYLKFKDEYFPGEKIIVKVGNGYRVQGIIKEKVVFNQRTDENNNIIKPFISYRVFIPSDQGELVVEDSNFISRERNRFTKSYVKTFLKMSLIRTNRLGAPWIIRDEIAKKYKISLEWPSDVMKFEYVNPSKSLKKPISSLLNNDDDENEHENYNENSFNSKDSNENLYKGYGFSTMSNKLNNTADSNISLSPLITDSNKNSDDHPPQMGIFNQKENTMEYGMRSTRGFSHSIFENLKETPPTGEEMYIKWCENWYQILQKTTAYFDDLHSENNKARDKVIKLFKFIGVKITDKFDPENTHFIISQRTYSSREQYNDDDPFHYVQMKRIKVWHYEKCQRFFKSIKISNRKIDQLAKQKKKDEDLAIAAKLKIEENLNKDSDKNNLGYVNIAPAPLQDINGKGRKLDDIEPKKNKRIKKENDDKVDDKKNKLNKDDNDENDESTNGNDEKKSENEQQNNEKKSHKIVIVDDLLLPSNKEIDRPKWKKLNGFEYLDFTDSNLSLSNVLEVWIFLNMFHEALIIDTFTFDDFIDSLQWKDIDEPCPLLLEIICCLLNAFVDQSGELQITLPVNIKSELEEKERERREKIKRHEKKQEKDKKKNNKEQGGDENIGDDSIINIESDSSSNEDEDEEVEDEDEDEDSGSEYEEEDINHNAYSILNYKKISWNDRLKNKDFKNGHWILVLIGIFSISEYIPEFKEDIKKILEKLAPVDETPSLDLLMKNFYLNIKAVDRVSILSILMELLLNGTVIRSHMDYVVEKSASLRRERFELQKELKSKIEIAHNANKEVLDVLRGLDIKDIKQKVEEEEFGNLKTTEEREHFMENRNKGGRPIQNTLLIEPTALEKAVGAAHPEFLKVLNSRTEKVKDIEELKKTRLEIDRNLVDLNCSRIRYLGRDRVWNRYWWFERNGLPNLGSNKYDDDDDNDNENDNENNDDDDDDESDVNFKHKDDDDEDNTEYDSESYLMGRIWIQGPSDVDILHLEENENIGMNRKVEEETNEILSNGKSWVYVDEIEDFNKLIKWLNDKGTRERLLKKELLDCKDRVLSSFKTRQEILKGGELDEKLQNYIKDLEGGKMKEDIEKSKLEELNEKDGDDDIVETDSKSIQKNGQESEDSEEKDVQIINIDADSEKENDEDYSEDDIPRRRTRSGRSNIEYIELDEQQNTKLQRGAHKGKHVDSEDDDNYDNDHKEIDEDEEADGLYSTSNDEFSDKSNESDEGEDDSGDDIKQIKKEEYKKIMMMVRKYELPSALDPPDLRGSLLSKANHQLSKHYAARRAENMASWVNSAAIEKLGHTHYAGPIIVKAKKGSKKSNGRKKR